MIVDFSSDITLRDPESCRVKQILDEAGKCDITVLKILSVVNETKPMILALSYDPIDLLLIVLRGAGECYELFDESDRGIFYDGEVGVGNFTWIPSEKTLVFYKWYIVHDYYLKTIVRLDDQYSVTEEELDAEQMDISYRNRNYYFFMELQRFYQRL